MSSRGERAIEALALLVERPPAFRDFNGTDESTCGYCHRPIERPGSLHAIQCPWMLAKAIYDGL